MHKKIYDDLLEASKANSELNIVIIGDEKRENHNYIKQTS